MDTSSAATPSGNAAARPGPRRSREELEQLAAQFVGGPSNAAESRVRPRLLLAAAAAVPLLAAAGWWFVSGESPDEPVRQEAAPAPNPTEEYVRRFEAERERNRQLAAASSYLDRVAAEDRALLQEMSERAQKLAERTAAVESEPEPAATPPATLASGGAPQAAAPGEPEAAAPAPRAAPDDSRATAGAEERTVAPRSEPPPAQTASSAPAQASTAAAPRANCRIHVSELSKSGTLTYADIANMKGVRMDPDTGRLTMPPVPIENAARSVVFQVTPDGCARVLRYVYNR